MANLYLFYAASEIGPNYWQKFVVMHPGTLDQVTAWVGEQVRAGRGWLLSTSARYNAQLVGTGAAIPEPMLICYQPGTWEIKVAGVASTTPNEHKAATHDHVPSDDLTRASEDQLNQGAERL